MTIFFVVAHTNNDAMLCCVDSFHARNRDCELEQLRETHKRIFLPQRINTMA
jgi:hypothetical protein